MIEQPNRCPVDHKVHATSNEPLRVTRLNGLRTTWNFVREPFATLESTPLLGDLVITRIFGASTLVLAHPSLVAQVLQEGRGLWKKDRLSQRASDVFGQGLLLSEGEVWKQQRRRLNPAFNKGKLDSYEQTIRSQSKLFLSQWPNQGVRDVAEEMSRLTLDVAVRTLFGANVSDQDAHRVGKAFSSVSHFFASPLAMLPFDIPRWLPLPILRRHARAIAELDAIVTELVQTRRRTATPSEDLLSMLLEDNSTQSPLSDQEIRDQLLTFLLAGHETTALTLTFAMFELGRRPELREALRAEVDRLDENADPESLVVTNQIIQESMRLYPPAYSLSRENSAPTHLAGVAVEKGTLVIASPWTLHRDERWHPQPHQFSPERWTPSYENSLPDGAYFPFGFGPRKCIGARFAMREAVLLLSAVARSHDWSSVEKELPPLQPAITCRPTRPVNVLLQARTRA